jgi:antitoxin HicB
MNEIVKNLDYYSTLPYGISLRRDEDGDWIARIEELSGCIAHGSSQAEALENIEDVKRVWIEDALEAGEAIPDPRDQAELPSGKWLQRVPRSLHKKVADLAEQEGVSLNQLVTSILAEAVGTRVSRAESVQVVKSLAVLDPFQGRRLQRSLNEVWLDSVLEKKAKAAITVWKVSNWRVSEPKPRQVIDLTEMLKAGVRSLPNELVESDFKVNDDVTNKKHAIKEHAIKTFKA